MKFFRNDVLVSVSQPPEEIVTSVTGVCGLWQTVLIAICIVLKLVSVLDVMLLANVASDRINYTCVDGSTCVNINGTECKHFVFENPFNVSTFTEQLKLVCEDAHYTVWITSCYRFGLLIGFFVAGLCNDKYGLRCTAMVFIALQSITGFITISIKHVALLILFVATRGLFSSAICFLPDIAVCEMVGNKWRTIVLGVVSLPPAVAFAIFPSLYSLSSNISRTIGVFSMIPLIFLIPLLIYRDSPNYVHPSMDLVKDEGVLRLIAKFNQWPMSPYAKIRPVQVLNGSSSVPKRSTFFDMWKPIETRKVYIASTSIWFFCGFSMRIITYISYKKFLVLELFGLYATVGHIIGVALCHFAPHKKILGIFAFLRSLLIAGLLINDFFWNGSTSSSSLVLQMAASVVFFTAVAAMVNLTPRIFPTELRGTGIGYCNSLLHLGYLFATMVMYHTKKAQWILGLLLLLNSVFETSACFWLWNVHQRELPDYLLDCIRFATYYKPTRHYTISDEIDEIEVAVVQLNESGHKHENIVENPI